MPIRKPWHLATALLGTPLYGPSTTTVESPTVRVLNAVDHRHNQTAMHKHDLNRVMIYLTPAIST